MKVAIGYNLQPGPWGGGNQFALSLSQAIVACGGSVCYTLKDKDIDVILITDPRWWSSNISFGSGSVLRYLIRLNDKALVVHRINECDERKGTKCMNFLLRSANYISDHTVFIASWLKDLRLWQHESPYTVILNGADQSVFQDNKNVHWDGIEKLKLVTHHWSANWFKGFDVYEKIDYLLGDRNWKNRIEFTFIGNLPKGFSFRNAEHIPALSGDELASQLAKHHVYITASRNEPAGMHHIEGAMCGLPILYNKSGGIPEYCEGFGIEFSGENFVPSLEKMFRDYPTYRGRLSGYPHTATKMCSEYIHLFQKMLQDREKILCDRRLLRSPRLFFQNLISM